MKAASSTEAWLAAAPLCHLCGKAVLPDDPQEEQPGGLEHKACRRRLGRLGTFRAFVEHDEEGQPVSMSFARVTR